MERTITPRSHGGNSSTDGSTQQVGKDGSGDKAQGNRSDGERRLTGAQQLDHEFLVPVVAVVAARQPPDLRQARRGPGPAGR